MELFEENDDVVEELYHVVVNAEGQHSIWPDFKEIPLGWSKEGCSGTKEQCLDHIDVVWTDIRPLSVQKHEEELRAASNTHH